MAYQLDRDQETNAMLAGDIRRALRITMLAVTIFAVILSIGSLEAGFTLIRIIGVPLLVLALLGKFLSRWCGDASAGDLVAHRRTTPDWDLKDAGDERGSGCGRRRDAAEPAPGDLRVRRHTRCRIEPVHPRRPVRRPVAWRHLL